MSMISEVKCARCDRRFSGLRSRCPYCGARRMGRGKYSGDDENARGKLIIGILIMIVLVAAVVVLLISSLRDNVPDEEIDSLPPETESSGIPSEDDNSSLDGTPTDYSPAPVETAPEDTAPPPPVVESVTITYLGSERTEFTAKKGEKVPLKVKITPGDIEATPVWESSNEDVFTVLSTGVVTGIGNGTATLTVTVDGVSATCIVRVSG